MTVNKILNIALLKMLTLHFKKKKIFFKKKMTAKNQTP